MTLVTLDVDMMLLDSVLAFGHVHLKGLHHHLSTLSAWIFIKCSLRHEGLMASFENTQ